MMDGFEIMRILNSRYGIDKTMDLLCGDFLGHGIHRNVYAARDNDKYVVKVERDISAQNFTNIREYNNWNDYKSWRWFAKYLAPCFLINDSGTILIQQRAELRKREEYPIFIPGMFTDVKIDNFGWIGKQFVCIDYSLIPAWNKGKMKRANWDKHGIYK